MICVILAAGQGTRIRSHSDSKPLTLLHGVPLIEWALRSAKLAGCHEFVVVTGYEGPRIAAFLKGAAERLGVKIAVAENPDWQASNGLSVLAAEPLVAGRGAFALLMSDHVFEPAILADLGQQSLGADEVILAVDRDLANPLVDLDDVTCVVSDEDQISAIGKGLTSYNAFDTGIFLCTDALFAAIRESVELSGDSSLSGGMRRLAARGKARTHDIGDRFWIDVDDPAALAKAEETIPFADKIRKSA